MNKKYIKWMIRFIIITFLILLWASSMYDCRILKEQYNKAVSVRIQGEGISEKSLRTALKNEVLKKSQLLELTMWNQVNKVEVMSKDLMNKASAKLYEVSGDSSQVCPMEFIAGARVIDGDYKGCVIDEETAYSLFGTKYAVGNTIVVQNRTYYVRGVIKASIEMLIIQIEDEQNKYNNLEFICNDIEKGNELINYFFVQNGLEAKYIIIESAFYTKIAEIISIIPVCIVGIVLLMKSIVELKKQRKSSLIVLMYIFAEIFIFIAILWMLGLKPYWPERLIPSKWSDFNFWVNKYNDIKDFIKATTYIMPVPKDVILLQGLKKVIIRSVIIVFLSDFLRRESAHACRT